MQVNSFSNLILDTVKIFQTVSLETLPKVDGEQDQDEEMADPQEQGACAAVPPPPLQMSTLAPPSKSTSFSDLSEESILKEGLWTNSEIFLHYSHLAGAVNFLLRMKIYLLIHILILWFIQVENPR